MDMFTMTMKKKDCLCTAYASAMDRFCFIEYVQSNEMRALVIYTVVTLTLH